jgi:hypothetical protein
MVLLYSTRAASNLQAYALVDLLRQAAPQDNLNRQLKSSGRRDSNSLRT